MGAMALFNTHRSIANLTYCPKPAATPNILLGQEVQDSTPARNIDGERDMLVRNQPLTI